MLFLMNGKELRRTGKKHPIYKYETGVDNIKVLIPETYNDVELRNLNCVLQIETPEMTADENGNLKHVGYYKYCPYDDESIYERYLNITVPITTSLTKNDGMCTMWLLFILNDEEDASKAKYVLKTDSVNFEVLDNKSPDAVNELHFDEIWEHTTVDVLNHNVQTLSEVVEAKADTIELVNNEIVLKSGDSVLTSVKLTDDVAWKEL